MVLCISILLRLKLQSVYLQCPIGTMLDADVYKSANEILNRLIYLKLQFRMVTNHVIVSNWFNWFYDRSCESAYLELKSVHLVPI